MKVASWNVNSLRVRLPQVLHWINEHAPDILALQELKQIDADFPIAAIVNAGYQAVWSGQKTYNGVALLARNTCHTVETSFPTFPDEQKRLLACTVDDLRIINVYVPNGQQVGSDKYLYKLMWLEHLYEYLKIALTQYEKILVVGDFNIAPSDQDVYNPMALAGHILCSEAERAALQKILSLGFFDSFRLFPQPPNVYSWWDYRTFAFNTNRGLRIDLILSNHMISKEITRCWVDTVPRGWPQPSDHAPVIVEC